MHPRRYFTVWSDDGRLAVVAMALPALGEVRTVVATELDLLTGSELRHHQQEGGRWPWPEHSIHADSDTQCDSGFDHENAFKGGDPATCTESLKVWACLCIAAPGGMMWVTRGSCNGG